MSSAGESELRYTDTTLGKKALLAVTGVVLFGFVVSHMLGNLLVFAGADALNAYAAGLRKVPALLWGARLVLLASLVVHTVVAVQLVALSAAARPVAYRKKASIASTYASRWMKVSGPLLALFILFHLAHLTWPGTAVGPYEHDPHDVYSNVVRGFQVGWASAIYLAAQALLGLHLHHGAWSLLQTLGITHPRYDAAGRRAAQSLALLVVAGNVAIPLGVLTGVVR